MSKRKNTVESGQAIVLLALGAVVMLGFAALAIDGGMVYADNRHAQNAADAASLAGAGMGANKMEELGVNSDNFNCSDFSNSGTNMGKVHDAIKTAAVNRAGSNGYTIDTDVSDDHGIEATCVDSGGEQYIEITTMITRSTNTSLIHFVYNGPVQEQVEAVTRIEPPGPTSLFFGNAVVGLDPDGFSFEAQSNAQKWTIKGGGVFANNDAEDKHSRVTFPDGHCATAVGSATGFSCGGSSGNSALKFDYPTDIQPLLPPIPACDGTAYLGGDGKVHPEAGKDGSRVSGAMFENEYAPGLYCIEDANGNFHGSITGTDVTFYILDEDFTMKFNGGGYFSAQAPTSGTYANVLMFSHLTSTAPCSQNIEFRGNGGALNRGTIFMPSACINLLGNSDGDLYKTQVIGYQVYTNGNAEATVDYQSNENYEVYTPPVLNLQK